MGICVGCFGRTVLPIESSYADLGGHLGGTTAAADLSVIMSQRPTLVHIGLYKVSCAFLGVQPSEVQSRCQSWCIELQAVCATK